MTSGRGRRMSLLSLPPELIQMILWMCDPPSFLQAAFSCRILLENASTTTDLILHQYEGTPGVSVQSQGGDSASPPTNELFRRLLQASYRELYGAEFHSNSKIYEFEGRVIDTHASDLTITQTQQEALLVFKGDPTVYLVNVRGGELTLKRRIELPAQKFGKVEIIGTAFDANGFSILHTLAPNEPCTHSSFVKQALESNSTFLARYEKDLNSDRDRDIITLHTFPQDEDCRPLCFAVCLEKIAICWQYKDDDESYRVVMYEEDNLATDGEPIETEEDYTIVELPYSSYALSEFYKGLPRPDIPELKGPSVKMAFNDRGYQLLHYYHAQPLFGSFTRTPITYRTSGIEVTGGGNSCLVEFSPSLSLQFSIGIPFFCTHEQGNPNDGATRCHWMYLSIGIATHRMEGWKVACLLVSESNPGVHRCDHRMNVERGRRFDQWHVAAQLGGFAESDTSHGSIIAASKLGTRIALASWKTVTIWPLDPAIVITHSHSTVSDTGFYPDSWQSEEGNLVLRPVVMELDAVCYQLHFTDNENEIITLTDKGIIFLYLDSKGQGVRVVEPQGNKLLEG